MKKIILIIFGILIISLVVFYIRFFVFRPAAGIAYTGYVKIDSLTFAEIKSRLVQNGCRQYDDQKDYLSKSYGRDGLCGYHDQNIPAIFSRLMMVPNDTETGINIRFYHGNGLPGQFYITEDKLWAGALIPVSDSPDQNKFKELVRQSVIYLRNIVQIQENSWKIEAKKYYPETMGP